MATDIKLAGNRKSFYRSHILPALQRLVHPRRRSVWDVDLYDDGEGDGLASMTASIFVRVVAVVFLMLIQALVILLPAAYLVQVVFVVPGGLPGVIGRQLAEVCLGGGSCDVRLLMGSYAFAVVMLVNIAGLIGYSMLSGAGYFDEPDEQDVPLGLAVIDERLTELHNELIAAHVLPPLPEDDDDDPAD